MPAAVIVRQAHPGRGYARNGNPACISLSLSEGAALCSLKGMWDRATRGFAIISSLFLGSVHLLIAAEWLWVAAMGKGLGTDTPQRYRARAANPSVAQPPLRIENGARIF
ncbi:MAG: hypothetical protein ACYTAS_20245 [Planctomycetota bacterium]|jgi:hypothetical protein